MAIIYTSRNLPGSFGGDYGNGAWGSLMNSYAVRFTSQNSGPGSAYAGSTFTFSGSVFFPYDGIYTVKASADNSGGLSVAGVSCSVSGFSRESSTSFFSTRGTKSISGSVTNGPGDDYQLNPYGIAFTIDAPNQPPAPTVSLSTNRNTIISGECVTLNWSASGVGLSSASLTDVSSPGYNGSDTVCPTSSKIYTYTVSGQGGTSSASQTITVYQPVFANISASPNPIFAGQSATLSWSVSGDASQASIDQGIGSVLFNSSTTISPTSTTTYTLSASGNGGSDTDSVQIVVNQIPQITATFPIEINYEDLLSSNVTYRYATSGVTILAEYSFLDGSITNESYLLPGTSSDESGNSVTNNFTPNISWNDYGPSGINLILTANGGGGSISIGPFNINVNIDKLPETINIPERLDLPISQDPVVSPDEDTILSDPIVINDIDIPVEITASRPVQVRFDDDDPTIEANWKSLRSI